MFEQLVQLITMLKALAPEVTFKVFIVLWSIIGLRYIKVIPTSKWARAANIFFSLALSGVTFFSASNEEVVVVFTLTSGFAAALWELITKAYEYITKGDKPFSPPALG